MSYARENQLIGHLFEWRVRRDEKTFRTYVVEPAFFEPCNHDAIFYGVINTLTAEETSLFSPLKRNKPILNDFDLVTFPEAFITPTALIAALQQLGGRDRYGCVHVGLRPSIEVNHLFTVEAIQSLAEELLEIESVEPTDIRVFQRWLSTRRSDERFNIACVFTVDFEARIRVCLHPKMVRSKYEANPFDERHMANGNVLSLITLIPENHNLLSITIQPLICSDALELDTDNPEFKPLDAVNKHSDSFSARPPEHVDIVSVATCTPQSESSGSKGQVRKWHQEFRNTFIRAAKTDGLIRHAHAAFVLANFWCIGPSSSVGDAGHFGGLSGAFLPTKLLPDTFPSFVKISSYGKSSSDSDNAWSDPGEPFDSKRSVRAFLMQLTSEQMGVSEQARMLGFTIARLPRHAQPWSSAGVEKVDLYVGVSHGASQAVEFSKGETHAV